jgi:hypothetical protein
MNVWMPEQPGSVSAKWMSVLRQAPELIFVSYLKENRN